MLNCFFAAVYNTSAFGKMLILPWFTVSRKKRTAQGSENYGLDLVRD
jgi:hypothetical protein